MSRASCLVLILAAIIYWQIREIDTVLRHWDPGEDGVDALGVAASAGILVDVSDVDGTPAAVLVVDDAGTRTAYAVERSCTTGSPALIAGPISLP